MFKMCTNFSECISALSAHLIIDKIYWNVLYGGQFWILTLEGRVTTPLWFFLTCTHWKWIKMIQAVLPVLRKIRGALRSLSTLISNAMENIPFDSPWNSLPNLYEITCVPLKKIDFSKPSLIKMKGKDFIKDIWNLLFGG
jgi:hypothetical protein